MSLAAASPKETYVTQMVTHETLSNNDGILAEVFQVMKKHQHPLLPGGYMFSKNNHVTTKMG